jgi:DNA repair exonuclease SbcCD nuclease subunit
MRVLHFADFHFEKDKPEKCRASADFIFDQAAQLKPDLIVNAGDTFNRLQSLNDKSAISQAKLLMMHLANIAPVVIIKGNESHDSRGCLEIFTDLLTEHPIITTEGCESFGLNRESGLFNWLTGPPEDRYDCICHLFSYPEKAWFLRDKPNCSIDESNLLIQTAIKQIFTGFGAISMDAKCPVVLVGHGNISGSKLCSGQDLVSQDIMLSKHDLALARADVQCWGHIHECQEFMPNGWYSGSTFHNNWGEVTPRYILLHEIERGSCQTTKIQIPSRALVLAEIEIHENLLLKWLTPQVDFRDADVRARLHGTKEQQGTITDEDVESRYLGQPHSIKVERITTPTERVRSTDVTQVKTLPDKLTAWAKVTDQKLSPEVLALAADVERSVTL